MEKKMIVTLDFEFKEKTQIDNLITLLAKAEMTLKGPEVLAAGDAMRWLSFQQSRFNQEVQKINQPAQPQMTAMNDKLHQGESKENKDGNKSRTKKTT